MINFRRRCFSKSLCICLGLCGNSFCAVIVISLTATSVSLRRIFGKPFLHFTHFVADTVIKTLHSGLIAHVHFAISAILCLRISQPSTKEKDLCSIDIALYNRKSLLNVAMSVSVGGSDMICFSSATAVLLCIEQLMGIWGFDF